MTNENKKCDYLANMLYQEVNQTIDDTFGTLDKITNKIGNVFHMIDYVISEADERTSASLINYIKSTYITSTCFIMRNLAQEDVLKDILSNLYSLYAGFILTAVNLDSQITQSKTVKESFALVTTENLHDLKHQRFVSINDQLKSIHPDFNPVVENPADDLRNTELLHLDEETQAAYEHWNNPKLNTLIDADKLLREASKAFEEEKKKAEKASNTSASNTKNSIVDINKNTPLPSGRLLDVTFNNIYGKPIHIYLNLILTPIFVPEDLFDAFVKFQYPTTMKNRWLQWKSGEISFWKDFILEMDIRKEQRIARKRDKTNILSEMFKERNSNNVQHWKKVSTHSNRQNIANTILVVSKDHFEFSCKKAHIKFENANVRAKFFSTSMCLMMVVVDLDYSTATFYYNGLDKYGTYTFPQLQQAAKSDKSDLMDIMKLFSQGIAPRI
jgi:hypothetical protein